jgi:aspartyl protease family protein
MVRALILVALIGAVIGMLMPQAQTAEVGMTGHELAPAPISIRPKPVQTASRETRVARADDGHFYVNALVNGQRVRFLVDTGATTVALTVDDARRVGAPFSTNEFDIVGAGASGAVRGQPIRLDRVELDGKRVRDVGGAVVEGLHVSLLGQTFLSRMEMVQMSGSEMRIR